LALVGSNFLGNSWVKSAWPLTGSRTSLAGPMRSEPVARHDNHYDLPA
jgi:hypothetical protein